MIITQTDLAKLRIRSGVGMGESEILADLITQHQRDPARQHALEGEEYYKGENDIKRHSFNQTTILRPDPQDSTLDVEEVFRNPNASNVRTQHKFLLNHIEQKVSYISGKEPSIAVDDAQAGKDGASGNEEWDYQSALTDTTDARFRKTLLQWERTASRHGVAWLHEYKDQAGTLRQVVVSRLEGIPIYDTVHEQDLVEFVRWYTVDVYVGTKMVPIIKAEWWTAEGVTYYVQEIIRNTTGNAPGLKFYLDPDFEINPAPHYWEVSMGVAFDGVTPFERSRTPKAWGRVPFVELSNNSDRMTDLEPYKDLIDAYDLISSKGTNNLMDFNEFFAVIQGYGGDTAAAVAKKLQINRAISINGQGGNLEMKQLDLQMQGRIDWLKELWKAIHVFGQAVDVTNDQLGNAPSGVSLKFQYTLLDLKANNLIIEAELALKEHLRFVTEEINRKNGTQYDVERVRVTFNKSMITNEMETVTMIVQSDNLVPERTLLAAHPLVDDVDQAYKDLLAQRADKLQQQREQFGAFGNLPDATPASTEPVAPVVKGGTDDTSKQPAE